MRPGFLSLILILITMAIIAILITFTNPFSNNEPIEDIQNNEDFVIKDVTTPKRINQTQDVIDDYQQKSIERQTIEIE